jgi:hypothetical protein
LQVVVCHYRVISNTTKEQIDQLFAAGTVLFSL